MIFEVGFFLGSVIPGQFEKTFAVGLRGRRRGASVAEKVQVEFVVWVLDRVDVGHAHGFLVEFEGFLGVFNADHCVVLC